MANFSAEFPIAEGSSVHDVLALARKWLVGSPHTKLKIADTESNLDDGEVSFEAGSERVTFARAQAGEVDIGGLRYVRTESDFEWTTSIVTRKTPLEHLLSMQVACEALSTAVRLPPPKKPYFIGQALEVLKGGADGEIPVTDHPFRLEEDEIDVAAALMAGTGRNRLPIVYVSAGFRGNYLVDPDDLARYLAGMAHVVVEPSRGFSFRLRGAAQSRNVYGGTVGIYWPESSARKSYFVDTDRPKSRVQVEIARDIRTALANRRLKSDCNWSQLMEHVSRKRLEQLKTQGSTDLQEYVSTFDSDLRAKDQRLQEAEQEIARLTAELRRLSAGARSASGVLKPGAEQDLFENEVSDIVIDALVESQRTAGPGTRRHHVISDLLEANKVSGVGAKMQEEIKGLLRGYRTMDSRTRSALKRLGFEISDDGKHHKAIYQGDGRYTFIIPKTSSDVRAGLNLVSDINSKLF